MRKFTFLFEAIACVALQMQAVVVENVAGELSSRLTDTNVTELTITGSLDARDFKYMADKCNDLSAVDLSSAKILTYEGAEPVFGQQITYQANEIPQTSFFGKPLTSVVLPQNVRIVGYAAFAGCEGITQIEFPASLDSISGYAFSATGFSTLALPATVTKIGEGAFSRCEKLTSATVEAGHIGAKAFFADAALNDVKFGSGVTAIGNGAFAGCKSLATLRWSDATQLALIGNEAFIATQMSDAALAKFQKLSTLGAWAYAGTPVEEVTLPESVKEVGDGAFFYATHVTNLVLPSKVTKVAPYLTAGTNVANTNIWGNDITRIGDFALYNLSDIDRLTIPSQVTYIGTKAMAGMTGLTRITTKPTAVPLLGHEVWAGVEQKEVELAAASASYLSAMQWNEFKITKRYIMGDANSDDLVNVTDITTIINYILGNNPENFNFDAADCTPDSIINVSDITMVINLILSGSTTEVVGEWEVNTEDNVNIDDFNLAPGETRSIDVKLCNSQAYTALQFDLRLPEGLEIVSIGKADRIANHNIHSGTLPDGMVRFIAYNMQNADIKGNDGAIITLVVKASQALAPSDAIEVSHTVLATASDESFFAPVTVARVGNTTGVADVSQNAAKVYSQAGRVVIESAEATTAQLIAINGISINLAVEAGHNEYEAPAQGVYIVRIAGKSHKLVVRN